MIFLLFNKENNRIFSKIDCILGATERNFKSEGLQTSRRSQASLLERWGVGGHPPLEILKSRGFNILDEVLVEKNSTWIRCKTTGTYKITNIVRAH